MEPKIKLENIGKEFITRRQHIKALEGVNMTFYPGEFVSIVGPSGCGKSTIIRLIDDIIKPTEGTITVDGCTYDNKTPLSQDKVRKLGFIFQIPNLYPWLTVRENLCLPLKIYHLYDEEHIAYADELLEMMDLTEYADDYPNEISGGMAQRIGVIRGMVHKPQMLLMDEPFGALDDDMREKLNLELLRIWESTGITIVFITHNVAEAVLLSQRVYVMQSDPGRVKAELGISFQESRSLALTQTHAFGSYCRQIEDLIGDVDLSSIV